MGSGHNEAKFKAAILSRSTSNDWDEAKAEWKLYTVYNDPADRFCECDHSPIHQICVILNIRNGQKTDVGNVCVRRFLRLLSNRIFSVIKRIRADLSKSLNPKALELFKDRGVISHQEEQEYLSYWRKRKNMTEYQRSQKLSINSRVVAFLDKEASSLIAMACAHGLKVQQV
ncbi:MAG: hypothetical protein V4512_09900 [Pseudomonadota bacterium]